MNKLSRKIGIIIIAVTVLLNAVAWNSTAFCDWYIANIFPVWVNTYGRLTGIFPFSVGEGLILAGVLLVCAAVLLGVIIMLRGIAGLIKGSSAVYKYKGFRKRVRGFYCFFAWTLIVVCLIMTLNCFILYHASTFSQQYFAEDDGSYTPEELFAVYNLVVEECNRLSELVERDETGEVVYTSTDGTKISTYHDAGWAEGLADMADKARVLMKELGADYDQLDGWYPRPKALYCSDFMCQQHMQGYYFPFSMEANYNDVMHILNIPSTMCHELAHLRGYIYEDEANLIGYLACIQSEETFFQYAGYLSVLNYLYNDVHKLWRENPVRYEEAASVVTPIAVSEQVWKDNIFVSDQEWDRINGKALIDTEVVDKATDVLVDTNLKVNGVSDGKISYSRVVKLLLQYNRQ